MWKSVRRLATKVFIGEDDPPNLWQLFVGMPPELQCIVLEFCTPSELAALGWNNGIFHSEDSG